VFSTIAPGYDHSCGIAVGGGIYCWGRQGPQLGLNNPTARTTKVKTPTLVTTGTDWTEISAGSTHSCAVRSNRLFCWGKNNLGQLGLGDTTSRWAPTEVVKWGPQGHILPWSKVVAGNNTSCAYAAVPGRGSEAGNGWYCWGDNSGNKANLGAAVATASTPTRVIGLTGGSTSRIVLGGGHGCEDSTYAIRCWGQNAKGQVGNDTTTTAMSPAVLASAWSPSGEDVSTYGRDLAIGTEHGCAVQHRIFDRDASLYCWGATDRKQFSDAGGPTYPFSDRPERVNGVVQSADRSTPESDFTEDFSVVAGKGHTCVKDGDAIKCRGALINQTGQTVVSWSGWTTLPLPVP
jgi:alpha-tubulin suppressor-like RCC1 family protein